jgi:hypothetical protein
LRAASTCSICRSTSRIAALVPMEASETRRGSLASEILSARATVPKSFCRPTGFSRKSNAPIFVASTAVSIVPWPDIMTTGIVSWPEAAHSRSSVTPSVSGIQMSSSTSAGRSRARYARAAVAFSARLTRYPSSCRISERSSRMPTSSSTIRISLAGAIRCVSYAAAALRGKMRVTWAPRGAAFASSTRP